MSRRVWFFGAVITAAAISAFLLRGPSTNGASAQVAAKLERTQKTYRQAGSGIAHGALPPLAHPLANLLPDVFASPIEKLRGLTAIGDPFAAQLRAARSGDPLLLVHAINLTLHCADLPVQFYGKSVRQSMTEISVDPKTGKAIPPDEGMIVLYEAMLSSAPSRVRMPPDIVADVKRVQETWSLGNPPDYARRIEIQKKLSAALTDTQRASYSATIERSAAECRGRLLFGEEFGKEYRAALDRLVANGVASAQLFNRRAGWASEGLDKLTDHDYALVERAVAESQPDGLARLLVGGTAAVGKMDESWADEEALGGGLALYFNLGPLTACALGVSDCGPDSAGFRSACAMLGGCDQPDLASLLRHVFERDGLDPAVIDREINRVVDAYRRRDLDALGIRRKQ
jgi:hypothetical protein